MKKGGDMLQHNVRKPRASRNGLLLMLGMVFLSLAVKPAPAAVPGHDQTTASKTAPLPTLEEKYGIQVDGIHLTAAGYMLDFRYLVQDTAKASSLFTPGLKPYLIDQSSGAQMMIPAPPKIGPLRTSGKDLIAGRVNFMLFANPGCYIKAGNKVTVVMGECRIEDLVVQP